MHKVCSGHCTWQQNLEELILKTVFLVILLKKDKKNYRETEIKS